MAKFSSKPVKTFSIGYEEKDASYNELKKARFVANDFGCEHEELEKEHRKTIGQITVAVFLSVILGGMAFMWNVLLKLAKVKSV